MLICSLVELERGLLAMLIQILLLILRNQVDRYLV
jgi:hypothetical protein